MEDQEDINKRNPEMLQADKEIHKEIIKIAFGSLKNELKSFHSGIVNTVCKKPLILMPFFAIFVFVTFFVISMFIAPVALVDKMLGSGHPIFYPIQVISIFLIVICIIPVWIYYFWLALLTFASPLKTIRSSGGILSILQVIVNLVLVFALFHYFIFLFSNNSAYIGIYPVEPEYGWKSNHDIIDHLLTIPSGRTIVDCIYFSAVTTATVGYGDIQPLSIGARALTTFQIIMGFLLVAVVLARFMNDGLQCPKEYDKSTVPNQSNAADTKSRAAD